jgi:hypothetical protein
MLRIKDIKDKDISIKFNTTDRTLRNWKKIEGNTILPDSKIHCYRAFKLYYLLTEYKIFKEDEEEQQEHNSNLEILKAISSVLKEKTELIGDSSRNQEQLKQEIRELSEELIEIVEECGKLN